DVCTGSVQVLQRVEFKVEPQEDHTFEVEPHRNVDQARLKDDMDARSDVYVLNNSYKKCSYDIDCYYWEYTSGMFIHIFLYIDDMVFLADARLRSWLPRVCWIRFYNGKLVQTLLEGHSILSLKGSLSGDCDVEKNDRRTGFVDSNYVMGRSITRGCKGDYLAKGTRNRVRIQAKDSSRKREVLQAKKAESFKASKAKSSNDLRSKTPTKSANKQQSVAMFSTRAEDIAAAGCYAIILWIESTH
ncbi:hypothetical protein Tco_0877662, partial [Tanacetum coccineum]